MPHNSYTPDRFVIVRITEKDSTPVYKVYASWKGGYLGGDSWRLSSEIKSVTQDIGGTQIHTISPSVYHVHSHSYGMTMFGSSVYSDFVERLKEIEVTMEALTEEEYKEFVKEMLA